MLAIDRSAWEEHFTDPGLMLTVTRVLGWSLITIGVISFMVRYRRLKRREHEDKARERLKALGGKPLAYEAVEPLNEVDLGLLHRQLYNLIAVMAPFGGLPAAFLFFC